MRNLSTTPPTSKTSNHSRKRNRQQAFTEVVDLDSDQDMDLLTSVKQSKTAATGPAKGTAHIFFDGACQSTQNLKNKKASLLQAEVEVDTQAGSGAWMHLQFPSGNCRVHKFCRNENNSATTNNQVEYQSMLLGLTKFKEEASKVKKVKWNITVTGDSRLVIDQMNSESSVRNRDLIPLHKQGIDLVESVESDHHNISFIHAFRRYNTTADDLSKEALGIKHSDQQYCCSSMKEGSKIPELANLCNHHSGATYPSLEVSQTDSQEELEEDGDF